MVPGRAIAAGQKVQVVARIARSGNPVGANPFALGDFQMGGGMAGQSQILIDGVPTNGAYLNVVTVIPTLSVEEAAVIMLRERISALPVTDQGCLVGIVTETDIVELLVKIFRTGNCPSPELSRT